MEKVFNMVAPNPRNKPAKPSFKYILRMTESIDRSFLLPPEEGTAWILVFALKKKISAIFYTEEVTYTSKGYTTLR